MLVLRSFAQKKVSFLGKKLKESSKSKNKKTIRHFFDKTKKKHKTRRNAENNRSLRQKKDKRIYIFRWFLVFFASKRFSFCLRTFFVLFRHTLKKGSILLSQLNQLLQKTLKSRSHQNLNGVLGLTKKTNEKSTMEQKKAKVFVLLWQRSEMSTRSHLFQNKTFVVFFWLKLEKSSKIHRCRREHCVILVDEQKKKLSILTSRNVFLLRRNCWRPGKIKFWAFRQSLKKQKRCQN